MGFCHNEFLLKFVSYSYYEVYTNTQRAFAGLGFSYGSDEEAAFITTWLELCGLNGIKLLNLKIEDLDNSFDASICLLYTSPSPRDGSISRMPSSA